MPLADLDGFCRQLVRGTPDAVIYADKEGRIQFWNGGAERIFGFTEEEAIGQSLDITIPENLRERHWQGFAQTMQTGNSRYGTGDTLAVPALKKDGGRISIEFTILPFRDERGQMQGIAAILRNVTQRFEEMRALRRELAALRSGTAKGGGSTA
jgi:PAS domain S-box-containing protein